MKKIGILYHPMNKAAGPLAQELQDFLSASGVSAWMCSAWAGEDAQRWLDGTDLIITVGGDGTILRAAQVAAAGSIPITGVNLGRLGFMTDLGVDEARDKITALLGGEGWIVERAMLEIKFRTPGEKDPNVFHALNDVVIARGEIARMIRVEASIDNELLTTYKSDGVIAATATGSTGYALSAGGPVLHPRSGELLLVPILPHLSSAYALVLPSASIIKLRISAVHRLSLSIDGHINLPLLSGVTINVKQSAYKTRFLRVHSGSSFYGSLERKLKGKR